MTKDNRRAASPVQAGIDPLVAENYLLARLGEIARGPVYGGTAAHAAEVIRSQAERIAELEEVNALIQRARGAQADTIDALRADILAMRERAEAAESLLAEAREALEKERKKSGKLHDYANMRDAQITDALATLEKIAEVEEFRHASGVHDYAPALTAHQAQSIAFTTLSRLKPGEKGGRQWLLSTATS